MKRIYQGFSLVNTGLQKVEKFLGCVSLAVLFVVMIVNAVLRYLLQSGLNWSDELNGFLFVWFGFLAAAYAMSTDSHLRITAFVELFPKIIQYLLRVVMNVFMIVMFVMYLKPLKSLMRTLPISNVLRWPMKYVYAILPICFGVMCFHILFNILRDTMDMVVDRKEEKK